MAMPYKTSQCCVRTLAEKNSFCQTRQEKATDKKVGKSNPKKKLEKKASTSKIQQHQNIYRHASIVTTHDRHSISRFRKRVVTKTEKKS
jgi:hypothetical protein